MNRIFMYIGVIVGLALGANLPVEFRKVVGYRGMYIMEAY